MDQYVLAALDRACQEVSSKPMVVIYCAQNIKIRAGMGYVNVSYAGDDKALWGELLQASAERSSDNRAADWTGIVENHALSFTPKK